MKAEKSPEQIKIEKDRQDARIQSLADKILTSHNSNFTRWVIFKQLSAHDKQQIQALLDKHLKSLKNGS